MICSKKILKFKNDFDKIESMKKRQRRMGKWQEKLVLITAMQSSW